MSTGLEIIADSLANGAKLIAERTEPIGLLRIVSADGDTIPMPLAAALSKHRILRTVDRLVVEDVDLGVAALTSLTTSRRLSNLKELALLDCDWQSGLRGQITDAIGDSRTLSKLVSLELAVIDLSGPAMRALVSTRKLRALRRLRIASCQIGDEGLAALCRSPMWKRLEAVFLDTNGITDAGVADMIEQPIPKHLTRLHLRESELGSHTTAALALRFGADRLADAWEWWS